MVRSNVKIVHAEKPLSYYLTAAPAEALSYLIFMKTVINYQSPTKKYEENPED